MTAFMPESSWESLLLDELGELAWTPARGDQIAPGSGERTHWNDLVIPSRLRAAVARINPALPPSAIDEVVQTVITPTSREAIAENKRVHDFLVHGVRVTYTDEAGASHTPTVHLIDYRDPTSNDFLAANQVILRDQQHRRRLDVVAWVNGLPLAFFELKRASADSAALTSARAQLDTYLSEFPLAFRFNAICVITDGDKARYGTAFTPYEHYAPWNVDEDGRPLAANPATAAETELLALLYGQFAQRRLLRILRSFIAFAGSAKRIAKAHQYFAVDRALTKTIEAVRGDRKAGVVWHTQGSGKSFEMELYSALVARDPALGNPTIILLSDRNELDDQLYSAFQHSELLPEEPKQVDTRAGLREELTTRRTGGIYFSTLQKFSLTRQEREAGFDHPLLSDRRNIIVIVDEAHRSHYALLDGYARFLRQALPNATMIAFTGTPISETDRDTRNVFGDYIDIYDLTRAVEDGATVRVFYESRLIEVKLPDDVDVDLLDDDADAATEGLDDAEAARVRRNVAVINAVYGAPARLDALAADVIEHWETRREQMRPYLGAPGKAMIVCATRDICVDLYDRIIAARPDWHHEDDDKGRIKVVFSGSAGDPPHLRPHVRRPSRNRVITERAKRAEDDLEILIVQSKLLTGYDAPPVHTMYLDRPIRGAALMQALARVNRTFANKQDGLLVGYAPITENLHEALAEYTETDRTAMPVGQHIGDALAKVRDEHDVICQLLFGIDWRGKLRAPNPRARLNATLSAVEYLRSPEHPDNLEPRGEHDLAQRFRTSAKRLERFYALCSTHPDIEPYRDDIAFFKEVRSFMARFDAEDRRARGLPIPADVELYLRNLTASAIEADGVKDIYALAGIERPDLTRINEDYLQRLRESAHPHLAIEALRRLIEQEMRKATRHNLVQQQRFSELLQDLMTRYTNQHLTAAQVLAELAAMARQVTAEHERGNSFAPPLSYAEVAFYDAVAANQSALDIMGQGKLADIARDLVKTLRRDLTTDWSSRSAVQAKLRNTIRRLLSKYGYPPDAEQEAVEKVIAQMETFADEWSPDAGL